MTIKLHGDCVTRIQAQLAAALASLKVNHRRFLDYSSSRSLEGLDASLPTSGLIKTQLEEIFGDDDRLPEYSADWTSRLLRSTQEYQADASEVLLSSLEGIGDLGVVAEQIVSDFCALPHKYVVSLQIPETLASKLEPFAFPAAIERASSPKLCKVDREFNSLYEPANDRDISALFSLFSNAAPESGVCLQVHAEGFIDQYGTTFTASTAVEQVRSFFGLGLATFLFSVGTPRAFPGFGPARKTVRVHRWDGNVYRFDTSFDLDPDLSTLIDRIEAIEYGIIQDDVHAKYIGWALQRISAVFEAGETGARIRRAGRWLFDSYQGSNQLLSFVQAMIALEILLGDKEASDLTGLTELLSNRCAYLLGENQAERQEILKKFREIYRVRSQIVHSGKSRLSGKEQRLFFELRKLCQKVLYKEMELLLSTPTSQIARALIQGK